MKTVIILISVLFSMQLYAACKCNCDPADRSICASYYNIDSPCGAICPGATPGITPMVTACPVKRVVVNPFSQAWVWVNDCDEYRPNF